MLPYKNEFDRFAKYYVSHNQLQQEIAKSLLHFHSDCSEKILDLGCGGGAIFRELEASCEPYHTLIGIDNAPNMCSLHPTNKKTTILCESFDDDAVFAKLKNEYGVFDLITSSSSLQWSSDLGQVAKNMATLGENILIALFTQNTFSSLFQALGIKSKLLPSEEVLKIFHHFYEIGYMQVTTYKKHFDTTSELLTFIKKMGISGGKKVAPLKKLLKIRKDDTITTLEFEVLFFRASLR